jgi:hypothetical protein
VESYCTVRELLQPQAVFVVQAVRPTWEDFMVILRRPTDPRQRQTQRQRH